MRIGMFLSMAGVSDEGLTQIHVNRPANKARIIVEVMNHLEDRHLVPDISDFRVLEPHIAFGKVNITLKGIYSCKFVDHEM